MRLRELVYYSLDHGVVIDAFAQITLDKIELVQVEPLVRSPPLDKYLQYAEAVLLGTATGQAEDGLTMNPKNER